MRTERYEVSGPDGVGPTTGLHVVRTHTSYVTVSIATTPPPLRSWTYFGVTLLQALPTYSRSLKVCGLEVYKVVVSP